MTGLQILVPRKRRTFVPIVKLREDANLSQEEWNWIQSTASMDPEELAKDCAVPKEDPMHRLKIEFAHSTAKLTRQTQLKWDPSDLYMSDTLQVSIQTTTLSPPKVPQEVHPFALPPEPPKPTTTVLQSTIAMDQDPIWKTRVIDATTSKTFRVILFIKPTRHATQPLELFNRQLFELCPFSIFDALHHSVFNSTTYHELRKSLLQVTNEIVDLEIEMEHDTEQEIVLKERTDGDRRPRSKSNGDNDKVGSPLMDELGIKEEISPRMQFLRQRHRSSSTGDDAFRKGFCKRSSTSSLVEAFERSAPLVASILSLSSLLSPNGKENSALGIVSHGPTAMGMERTRSRSSMIEFETDRLTTNNVGRRRGSKASQPDFSRIVEKAGDEEDEALVDFKEMLQDLDPITSEGVLTTGHNNASSLSVQSTDSSASVSSDEYNSHGSGYGQGQIRRPLSAGAGTNTNDNLPLPLFWPLPRHRRSYSLVQSNDEPLSPGSSSAYGAAGLVRDGNSTRMRTNSHSSFVYAHHHHHHHPYHHHYQNQQPVYKNRFLAGKSYPHYLAHIQQHQNHPQHHNHDSHHQQQSEQEQQHQDDDYPFLEGCGMFDHGPSELIRLERQQQELQERWRMVSWTRQLNEWDHARTLKGEEELLGFDMDMDFDMGLTLAMNMNLNVSLVESDPDSNPIHGPEPQKNGMLSPPQSNSRSSLHSEES